MINQKYTSTNVYNVRKIVLDILYNTLFCDKKLNDLIEQNSQGIKEVDKFFIKNETTGVIENIEFIKNEISKYSTVKVNKLDKDVFVILSIGIYELYFMDKVPAFATINECVKLLNNSKNARLKGFVNAILRNITRKIDKNEANQNDVLNVNKQNKKCYFRILNINDIEEVKKSLKEDNIEIIKYDGKLLYNDDVVYSTTSYKGLINNKCFHNGKILISDASCVYLTDMLSSFINKNEVNILDTCSSPGGKTIGLCYSLINKNSNVNLNIKACDINENKIKKVNENFEKLKIHNNKNITNIETYVQDATKYNEKDFEKYDVVICDVPCTGLGVIDKKPDIMLHYTEEKRDSLVIIQKQIIEVSKHYVKKGGILSYSTCTENIEENGNVVNGFLTNNLNFKKIFEKQIKRNDENKSDGFYMCFMIKE